MLFAFRVDASKIIGNGHVIRCLTLASYLRDKGCESFFITRQHDGNLAELIKSEGFEVNAIPVDGANFNSLNNYANWLGGAWNLDAEATINIFANRRPNWVIVDHYAVDQRWEQYVRPHTDRLGVIDDLANRNHDCDLLLDQNFTGYKGVSRYCGLVPNTCHLLLGPRYALLQPQYSKLRAQAFKRESKIKRIFIYFGGADVKNLTGIAVEALLALNLTNINVDVVIDSNHPYAEILHERLIQHSNFRLHGRVSTLAPLMFAADLAIGAAGVTTWERCCLGLPTLVVTLAENQKPIAEYLANIKTIYWLGHCDDVDVTEFSKALRKFLSGEELRDYSARAFDLVDGLGAQRVVNKLLTYDEEALNARPVNKNDEFLLFCWANDPEVRANSFSQNLINLEEHHFWFKSCLKNSNCKFYIVEGINHAPIGQVRFQKEDDKWLLHYSLSASFRGKCKSKSVLLAAMTTFFNDVGNVSIQAKVKDHNVRSIRVFQSLGFVSTLRKRDGVIIFKYMA